jgi:hypothetical protein
MALTRYTRKTVRGREVIDSGLDGKQDVTADFDALICELLLNPAPKVIEQLDGAAKGFDLTEEERAEIAAFREVLVKIVERHNAGSHVKKDGFEAMGVTA